MVKFYLTKKAVEDLSGIWISIFENWSGNQANIYYRRFYMALKRADILYFIGKLRTKLRY